MKKNTNIRYSHFRVGSGTATCAGQLAPDGESYIFAVSFCAPDDNFSKKEGRKRATKKLHKLQGPNKHRHTSGAIGVVDEKEPRNSELGRRAVVAAINSLQTTRKDHWYKGLSKEDVENRTIYLERTKEERTPFRKPEEK